MNVEKVVLGVSDKRASYDNLELVEGSYDATSATNIYENQIELRTEILNKIDDDEYKVKLFNDLYKIGFNNINQEIAMKHIMQRVLLGTIINRSEEQEKRFLFGKIDAEIVSILQDIVKRLNDSKDKQQSMEQCKQGIRKMIDKALLKKGLLTLLQ